MTSSEDEKIKQTLAPLIPEIKKVAAKKQRNGIDEYLYAVWYV